MQCEYAKENACVKRSCIGCDQCNHPVKFDDVGIQICDICEKKVLVPLLGSRIQLTTTRNQFEIEKLDNVARYECRMREGIVENESICNKTMCHDVLIDNYWITIMSHGMQIRNIHVTKRNWND